MKEIKANAIKGMNLSGMTKTSSDTTRKKGDQGNSRRLVNHDPRHGVCEEVREKVQSGKGSVRIGCVENGFIKPHWFIGNTGRCEWVISKNGNFLAQKGNPDMLNQGTEDLASVLGNRPVDVVFLGGCHSPKDSRFWENEELKGVLWINRRRSLKTIQHVGWTRHQRRISHCSVGGVTNGTFWITVATRDQCGLEWRPQRRFVSNVLKQVIDPTVGGRQCLPTLGTHKQKTNTALGLLDWDDREGYVKVPTVYSKDKWTRRKLTSKELCDALNLPGFITSEAYAHTLRCMTKVQILGKIIQFVFQGIQVACNVRRNTANAGVKRCPPSVATTPRKRACVEMPNTSGELARKYGDQDEAKRSTVKSSQLRKLLMDQESTVTDKAVKSDDAKVPEHLWNIKVMEGLPRWHSKFQEDDSFRKRCMKSLGTLRSWLLKLWKSKVERSFYSWFHGTEHRHDMRNDLWDYGLDAIQKVKRCSWWSWNSGSSIFFWRWPKEYLQDVLYGAKARLDADPPRNWDLQPPIESQRKQEMIQPKVDKVLQNGYVKLTHPNKLRSLLFMFDVPKGANDIRLVYDGSKSGLNDCLWAPWFALPTVETMCRTLEPGLWCADNDYGDQFLNFPLDKDIRAYCGVDLSQLYPKKASRSKNLLTAVWTRNAMGLKTSPYASVQGALRAKRIMMEDKTRKAYWHATYINNDLRITAKEANLAWRASSQVAKICSFLGLQDAARKRREPSQEPGAWAGAVVSTGEGKVQKSVTQERWDKTKRRIQWLALNAGCQIDKGEILDGVFDEEREMNLGTAPKGCINHKLAERYRGFLVYVSRTYTSMVPFLKGLHLTLDSWRDNRDSDGWRITNTSEERFEYGEKRTRAGKFVTMVPRFKDDMNALLHLTRHENPPKLPVRPTRSMATYLVGDASGSGYGATLWGQGNDMFVATHGGWTEELSNASSNEREAYNLLLNVEAGIKEGELAKGTELFVFTDNMVSERCYHSGRSKSKSLHSLIMKMHDLTMQGHIFTHFVWISGERMKKQGGDGLSRGDLNTGVLQGDDYLSHIPLAQNAFERHPTLVDWLRDALKGEDWIFLKEEDWYGKAYEGPNAKFVWSPAPCVAEACLEQVCEVKHVHPASSHIVLCPAIMTYSWRKQLNKLSDVLINIKQGSLLWPTAMLEPLTIAFVGPLLNHRPWTMRRSKFVAQWKDKLQGVYSESSKAARDHLRKFWTEARKG